MGWIFRLFNALCFLCLATVVHAAPEQPKPYNISGIYSIAFGHLPIGRVHVTGGQQGSEYSLKAKVEMAGVAKLVSSHQSNNQVKGKLKDAALRDFAHAARNFETRYTSNDGWRTIALTYAAGGILTDIVDEKAALGKPRPAIARDKLHGVSDMLTFVFEVREAVYRVNQLKQTSLSIPMYDTKRLSRVNVQIYGVVKRKWRGEKVPVLKVGLRREPVAGYTEKELKRERERPIGELFCYFTMNDDFQLVRVELPMKVSGFSAQLQ